MFTSNQQPGVIPFFNPNDSKSLEFITVRGFSFAVTNVIKELNDYIIFLVDKVYSWDALGEDYCRCLFDAQKIPTLGIWKNNTLFLYQKNSLGYLCWIYFLEDDRDLQRYRLFVYFSLNGKNWQKYAQE